MNHNIWKNHMFDILLQVLFCEEKSVQLSRVAFFQSDLLQNPYFRKTVVQHVYLMINGIQFILGKNTHVRNGFVFN